MNLRSGCASPCLSVHSFHSHLGLLLCRLDVCLRSSCLSCQVCLRFHSLYMRAVHASLRLGCCLSCSRIFFQTETLLMHLAICHFYSSFVARGPGADHFISTSLGQSFRSNLLAGLVSLVCCEAVPAAFLSALLLSCWSFPLRNTFPAV